MARRGFVALLTLCAIGILNTPSEARGGRGGGFHGGKRHMGSVRHAYYFRPRTQAPTASEANRPVAASGRAQPVAWGARARALPAGYARRWWRDRFWYAGAHAWYVADDGAYVATRPPIGMIVHVLPAGTVEHTFQRRSYSEYNGVWLRPVMSGRASSYEVVARPKGA